VLAADVDVVLVEVPTVAVVLEVEFPTELRTNPHTALFVAAALIMLFM